MHWLAALILLLQLTFPLASAKLDQTTAEITNLGAAPEFGKHITFSVRVTPIAQVKSLLVFITPEGSPTVWETIDLKGADASGKIDQQVDVRSFRLYPFSRVDYRFVATLQDGQQLKSATQSFKYEDTRFQWHSLESGIFEINWYSDDASLGETIANIAKQGLERGQAILNVTPPTPLRIYAYNTSADLQDALQLVNQPWVAGHATPELGLILISAPTGLDQRLELNRQIPHEIMHILQYQVVGSRFTQQPAWLLEGMASLNEASANPDYRDVLNTTVKNQQLLPIATLCATFPRDAGGAFLAYAEADSFVRYLYARNGASGLRALMDQYQNGIGCAEGFSAATGVTLDAADFRWQQEELGVHVGGLVLDNLSPFLLLALVLFASAGLAFIPLLSKKQPVKESQP